MKNKITIICFFALTFFCNRTNAETDFFVPVVTTVPTVDFDQSMQTQFFPKSIEMTQQVVGIDGTELLDFFRALYNKNNLSKAKAQRELKIPKIIHQIWLSKDGKVPSVYNKYILTWLENHMGDWQYKLWTDADVAQLELYNQELYDSVENYGIKSDILKWEIIYRFGGVYADTDFECVKPLDFLHYTYDFYTCIQPFDTQLVQLGAGIFGAVPGHPILEHCIKTIKDDWDKKGAPARTGPIHFTRSFFAVAGTGDMLDIAFPATYFYPLGCRQKAEVADIWLKQESLGVHWWAKSWMPASYRPSEFRTINNHDSAKSWND